MTGVELGSGTGAGFTICGSTPGGGLIMPPLASNLLLRFFSWLSTNAPPWRDASGRPRCGGRMKIVDTFDGPYRRLDSSIAQLETPGGWPS